MKTYYSQNGIVVRRSIKSDINAMKDRLRKSDVEEIWASHNITPEKALKVSVEKSIFSATIENGKPIGIFGISTDNILGNKATVFLLATDDLDKIQRRFLRHCRFFIDMLLQYYPFLENYVHLKNKKSIQWLKWLKAEIQPAKTYGLENELFHYFYFKKDY